MKDIDLNGDGHVDFEGVCFSSSYCVFCRTPHNVCISVCLCLRLHAKLHSNVLQSVVIDTMPLLNTIQSLVFEMLDKSAAKLVFFFYSEFVRMMSR